MIKENEWSTYIADKINKHLMKEIQHLQSIYKELHNNIKCFLKEHDLFLNEVQNIDKYPEELSTIESDLSNTFIELKKCFSTVENILNKTNDENRSFQFELPKTLNLNESLLNENEKIYNVIENDIKDTIKELMKDSNSSLYKEQIKMNRKPMSPFFLEYIDLFEEPDPLVICKNIVENLIKKSKNTNSYSILKEDCCIKNSLSGLITNRKRNISVPYFCNSTNQKIPKTSFSFGETPIQCSTATDLEIGDVSDKRSCKIYNNKKSFHKYPINGELMQCLENATNVLEIFSVEKKDKPVITEGLKGGSSNWNINQKERPGSTSEKPKELRQVSDNSSDRIGKGRKFFDGTYASAPSLPSTNKRQVVEEQPSTSKEMKDFLENSCTSEEEILVTNAESLENIHAILSNSYQTSTLTSEEEQQNSDDVGNRYDNSNSSIKVIKASVPIASSTSHSEEEISKVNLLRFKQKVDYMTLPEVSRDVIPFTMNSSSLDSWLGSTDVKNEVSSNCNFIDSSSENDYNETDGDTKQLSENLFKNTYRSKQELNTPEEVDFIEHNVKENDLLARKNFQVLSNVQSDSF